MAIIRQKRKERFSIVDNKIIENTKLTFKARGLLIYMLSKPDDWRFHTEELAQHSDKEGISSIKTALKEIEDAGYLTRKQGHQKNGQFMTQDWLLTDIPTFSPQAEKPPAVKPSAAKPLADNRTLPNTEFKPNTDQPNTKQLTDGARSTSQVFDLWQNNWGYPNGIAVQDLTEWINEYGADLVHHAITYALRRNITSNGADRYLARKLIGYKQARVTTVEQAKKYEKQHEQQMSREYQSKGSYYKRPTYQDPLHKDYTPPKGYDR